LDFQICEMLLTDGVWRATTHNCAKFRHNLSFRCRDIAIFRIFKMAAAAILDFLNREFYWLLGSRGSRRIFMPNFVKIGQLVAKILRFFDFSRWRPSAILDSTNLGHIWTTHSEYLWVTISLQKFGYDRCSSFYNMNISIFDAFGWKMPIHTPKIGVFGQFDTQNGVHLPNYILKWIVDFLTDRTQCTRVGLSISVSLAINEVLYKDLV